MYFRKKNKSLKVIVTDDIESNPSHQFTVLILSVKCVKFLESKMKYLLGVTLK